MAIVIGDRVGKLQNAPILICTYLSMSCGV